MRKFQTLAGPRALPLIVGIWLAACATFVSPSSFSERLGAAYIAHTAVVTATAHALAAGDISSADGVEVQKIAVQAREVLDAARVASSAGDVKTAEGRLTMATSILAELQAYLRARGKS